MKRDTPAARRFAARRGTLRRDPAKGLGVSEAKVLDFLRRGREAGAQSLRSSATRAARASRPQEGPLTPWEWRLAAFVAAGGLEASGAVCILTGTRTRDVEDRRFHVHHPLPARELRRRGLHAHVWDPRNALWVLGDAHLQHETPGVRGDHRIPRELLPTSVWEFCAEMDATDGTSWATVMVERAHPAAGSSGITSPEEGA